MDFGWGQFECTFWSFTVNLYFPSLTNESLWFLFKLFQLFGRQVFLVCLWCFFDSWVSNLCKSCFCWKGFCTLKRSSLYWSGKSYVCFCLDYLIGFLFIHSLSWCLVVFSGAPETLANHSVVWNAFIFNVFCLPLTVHFNN